MLASDPVAARRLTEPLKQATANLSLSDVARGNNHGQRNDPAFQLLSVRLQTSLQNGDPGLLNAELDALYDEDNLDPMNGSWQVGQQVDAAKDLLVRALREDDAAMPAAALPAMRPVLRRIMEPPAFLNNINVDRDEVALLAVLDLFDETAAPTAFDTWFDGRTINKATPDIRKPRFGDMRGQLKAVLQRDDVSAERRIATLIRTLEVTEHFNHVKDLARMVFDDKLLSLDELAVHGPNLIAPFGDRGLVGLAAALARGKHARADAAWHEAIVVVTAEDADAKYRLELAQLLVKYKKPELAEKLVESWSPGDAGTAKKLKTFREKHFPAADESDNSQGTPL